MIFDAKIADIPIRFSGKLNDAFLERVAPYEYKIKNDEEFFLINYNLLSEITLPKDRITIKKISDREWFYDGDKYCFADFNEQIGKYTVKISIGDGVSDINMYDFHDEDEIDKITQALRENKKKMPNPKERKEADTVCFNPNMPLINSTDQATRILFLQKNVCSIHSSAIAYKDYGIIFSASSGTGKSTHTSLWKQVFKDEVTVVNDDSPLIGIQNDGATLYGSPWAGASGINTNKTVPLKAIVFLEQAPSNSIEKLPTLFALRYLLNQTNIPYDKSMTDNVYTLFNLLLSSVPCYLLKCLPDTDAVITVKNMIFKGE